MTELPDDIVKRFKAMYLIEKSRSKFLKMIGGRVVKGSLKTKDGSIRIVFYDHEIEVPESSVAKAVFLMEPSERIATNNKNRSKLVRDFLSVGFGSKEIIDFLGKRGVKIQPSLVSAVRIVIKIPKL